MTESERLAKVIYRAWISPFPDEADFAEFHDALELFADAREREQKVKALEQWKADIEAAQPQVLPLDPPQEPEPPQPSALDGFELYAGSKPRQTDRQTGRGH